MRVNSSYYYLELGSKPTANSRRNLLFRFHYIRICAQLALGVLPTSFTSYEPDAVSVWRIGATQRMVPDIDALQQCHFTEIAMDMITG